jgi:hypothetical protein
VVIYDAAAAITHRVITAPADTPEEAVSCPLLCLLCLLCLLWSQPH